MIPFRFESHASAAPDARAITVPEEIEDKEDLFAFLARSIPLPDYFGHNWDALDECLAEIADQKQPKIILIHQDIPLQDTLADQRIYLEILADSARNSKSLTVIFPPQWREHIVTLLE